MKLETFKDLYEDETLNPSELIAIKGGELDDDLYEDYYGTCPPPWEDD